MKKYKVGIAHMSHDHVWGELAAWAEQPDVEIVAGADDEPALLDKLRAEAGVTRVYSSLAQMLENEDLDIIQAAGGNSEGPEVVEAAAARGIHVVSEKPMAATLEQARRMHDAAKEAGTLLLINWPTAWVPVWQEMERRVLAGEIGEVRYVRYRSAHGGPVAIGCAPQFIRDLTTPEINGAGAFMDYCCYGASLAARFLGRPESVTGMRGYFGSEPLYAASDDNAIITAKYAHAFALCEASWTQPVTGNPTNPIVYGSEGSAMIQGGKLLLNRTGGKEETIEPPATEAPHRSAAEYLLHCLRTGVPLEGFCAAETSLVAQEILEAGLISADTGQTQKLAR